MQNRWALEIHLIIISFSDVDIVAFYLVKKKYNKAAAGVADFFSQT